MSESANVSEILSETVLDIEAIVNEVSCFPTLLL